MTNMPRGFDLGQFLVQATEDLVRVSDLSRKRAKNRDRDGHEQGGGDPLAGHVPQRDDHPPVRHAQHLIQIATDLAHGLDHGIDLEAGPFRETREIRGKNPHLDLTGDPEISGHGFAHGVGIEPSP